MIRNNYSPGGRRVERGEDGAVAPVPQQHIPTLVGRQNSQKIRGENSLTMYIARLCYIRPSDGARGGIPGKRQE
jgi:hypothetical protein